MCFFFLHYICLLILHDNAQRPVFNPNEIRVSDCSIAFLLLFNYIPLICVFITPPFSPPSVFSHSSSINPNWVYSCQADSYLYHIQSLLSHSSIIHTFQHWYRGCGCHRNMLYKCCCSSVSCRLIICKPVATQCNRDKHNVIKILTIKKLII